MSEKCGPKRQERIERLLRRALDEHEAQDGLGYSSTCWCIEARRLLPVENSGPAPEGTDQILNGPFVLEGGQIRAARRATGPRALEQEPEEPFMGLYRGTDIRKMAADELRKALMDLGEQLQNAHEEIDGL